MKCEIYTYWAMYHNPLRAYVNKRVSNEEDVDDIVQAVLIKVINYCERKNDVKHIKAWLYRITQNTIADYYKKKNQRTTNFNLENLDVSANNDYDEKIFIWLHHFLDRLPKKYALPLHLSDIKGIPQKEVATQMGLTLTATKSRIQRARKMLKEKFEECGEIEASNHQFLSYNVTKNCCINV